MIHRVLLHVAALALLSGLTGCEPSTTELGSAPVPENYEESIREWQEYRIGRLTEPTGWLRLVDLIWLEEGENRFGSGEDVDIRFPEGKIPERAGVFTLREGEVRMEVADGVTITHEGEPVRELLLFDRSEGLDGVQVRHDDLIWFIDRRGDRYAVRLFNLDTPEANAFEGFPAYPLDPEWHLEARFVPFGEERILTVDNVIGDRVDRISPGRVEFRIDGELYSLDAIETGSGLFLMVGDRTNMDETYQAGRYMIIDFPDEEGRTIIDFNKAYNMPCSFNRFTTCQLPPPQNRLDVAITAGEKRPVGWEGI